MTGKARLGSRKRNRKKKIDKPAESEKKGMNREKRTFELWNTVKREKFTIEAELYSRQKNEWKALCSYHQDIKKSLFISADKRTFNCLGCAGQTKGIFFEDYQKPKGKPKEKKKEEKKPVIDKKRMIKLAGLYHETLEQGIREVLREERGLSDKVIDKYRIGYTLKHQNIKDLPYRKHKNCFTIPVYKGKELVNIRYHTRKKNVEIKDLPYQTGLEYATWLYPESELKERTLILTEGEFDALCSISQGLPSITETGGAGTWKEEFTKRFTSKVVYIIFDCDSAGRKGAEKIAQELEPVAKEIRIVDLDPQRQDGYDLTDWFVTDKKSKEELLKLINKSPVYVRQDLPKAETKEEKELKEVWKLEKVIKTAKDFLKIETPKKKTLLGSWLKEKQIILISGWRGVGKSWLALSLLDSITSNESFCSWQIKEPVNCLYLDAEMAKPDLDERLLTLNPEQKRERPLLHWDKWQIVTEEYLQDRKIKLWVADNITSLTPDLDENVKAEYDSINQWLLRLRFKGISTILVHHLGKQGTQRGTSAREDNIDISIRLTYPAGYQDIDGCKFDLKFTKTRLRHRDLKDISDLQLQLIEDEQGQCTWTYSSIKKEKDKQILLRLNEGMTQADIARELNVTSAWISRVKKKAQETKLLDSKKKLTDKGLRLFENI